jgi:hypothetical protein
MIDAVRRGWSGMLNNHDDRSIWHENGTITNKGRQIGIFLDRLVSETDAQLPKMPETGKSAWMTALEKWRQLSKPIDAVSTVERVADKARDASDITGRLYGSPDLRAKVAGLSDDPAKMAEFEKRIKSWKTFAETDRQLTGNSRTGFRVAAQEDQDMVGAGADAVINFAQNPTPGNFVTQLARGGLNWMRAPSQPVADAMTPMFSQDPAVRNALLGSLENRVNGAGLLSKAGESLLRRYNLLGSGNAFANYAGGTTSMRRLLGGP